MSDHVPIPAPAWLISLRKKYGFLCAKLLSDLGLSDQAKGIDGPNAMLHSESSMRELTILGGRLGLRESIYLEKHGLQCACQIPHEVMKQHLEQLSPVARELCEKAAVPLPDAAKDPIESSDFWMGVVDMASHWANEAFRTARKNGPIQMMQFMSVVHEVNSREGNFEGH